MTDIIETNSTSSITSVEQTKKEKKTPQYMLNCAKRYRERHPEKIKEYREKYKNEKTNKLTTIELELGKMKKHEIIAKYKELEQKHNELLTNIKGVNTNISNIDTK